MTCWRRLRAWQDIGLWEGSVATCSTGSIWPATSARIPRRSPVILANSRRRPWAQGSLGDRIVEAKKQAWPDGTRIHFHDLRGTAAAKFYTVGFSEREIAEIMGWEEESVARIIRRYVGRNAAIKELIRKLDEARTRL